jgi:hypothetical protein
MFRETANGGKTDRRQLRRAIEQLAAGDGQPGPTVRSRHAQPCGAPAAEAAGTSTSLPFFTS